MNYKYRLRQLADKRLLGWLSCLTRCVLLIAICTLPAITANAAEARTRQQAIDLALKQNGGDAKVLGVQTLQTQDGRTVYAVKVLSNGRVRVFRINKAD